MERFLDGHAFGQARLLRLGISIDVCMYRSIDLHRFYLYRSISCFLYINQIEICFETSRGHTPLTLSHKPKRLHFESPPLGSIGYLFVQWKWSAVRQAQTDRQSDWFFDTISIFSSIGILHKRVAVLRLCRRLSLDKKMMSWPNQNSNRIASQDPVICRYARIYLYRYTF